MSTMLSFDYKLSLYRCQFLPGVLHLHLCIYRFSDHLVDHSCYFLPFLNLFFQFRLLLFLFIRIFFAIIFLICFDSFYIVFTERLALIRQQRAEAAKKREEEKAGMINFPWLVFLYLEFVLPLFASLSDASSFLWNWFLFFFLCVLGGGSQVEIGFRIHSFALSLFLRS